MKHIQLKVSDRIQFRDDRHWFTVMAVNERYAIVSHPYQETVKYCICDFEKMIRGSKLEIYAIKEITYTEGEGL